MRKVRQTNNPVTFFKYLIVLIVVVLNIYKKHITQLQDFIWNLDNHKIIISSKYCNRIFLKNINLNH